MDRLEDRTPPSVALWEAINRFREAPSKELDYLLTETVVQAALKTWGVCEDTLRSEIAQLSPVPPVAWNATLADAALSHSNWMAGAGEVSHRLPNEPDLVQRVGWDGVFGLGENVVHAAPLVAHAAFIVDPGLDLPGHRINLLDPQWLAVGVAVVEDYVTEDFGYQESMVPLTFGVASVDVDGDGRYDQGEGVPDLVIRTQGSQFSTDQNGAYQVELPPGVYSFRAVSGPIAKSWLGMLAVANENVHFNVNVCWHLEHPPVPDTASPKVPI